MPLPPATVPSPHREAGNFYFCCLSRAARATFGPDGFVCSALLWLFLLLFKLLLLLLMLLLMFLLLLLIVN